MPSRSRLVALLLLAGPACAGGEGQPATAGGSLAGHYHTDTLVTADGGSRVIGLELTPSGGATLTAAAPGQEPRVRRGQWKADGPNLTVVFTEPAPAETLGWRRISDRLVPVRWNRADYGEAGLTLNQ